MNSEIKSSMTNRHEPINTAATIRQVAQNVAEKPRDDPYFVLYRSNVRHKKYRMLPVVT